MTNNPVSKLARRIAVRFADCKAIENALAAAIEREVGPLCRAAQRVWRARVSSNPIEYREAIDALGEALAKLGEMDDDLT